MTLRIVCPTPLAAQALADLINIEGHAATSLVGDSVGAFGLPLVLAQCPESVVATAPLHLWDRYSCIE